MSYKLATAFVVFRTIREEDRHLYHVLSVTLIDSHQNIHSISFPTTYSSRFDIIHDVVNYAKSKKFSIRKRFSPLSQLRYEFDIIFINEFGLFYRM